MSDLTKMSTKDLFERVSKLIIEVNAIQADLSALKGRANASQVRTSLIAEMTEKQSWIVQIRQELRSRNDRSHANGGASGNWLLVNLVDALSDCDLPEDVLPAYEAAKEMVDNWREANNPQGVTK